MVKVLLAKKRGFCSGVERAIQLANSALIDSKNNGEKLYIRREIVHNKIVTEDLANRGLISIDDIAKIPDGSKVLFSAHGVSPAVWETAKKKNLEVIDATCPLVETVHNQVRKAVENGMKVIYIGHRNHDEVIGVLGVARSEGENQEIFLVESENDVHNLPSFLQTEKLTWLSQTTLSVSETDEIVKTLHSKFPHIQDPSRSSICFATTERQNAVTELCKELNSEPGEKLVIVVGSKNSSNSLRLKELAENYGIKSILIDKADEFDVFSLSETAVVGVTSGASVPENLVDELVEKLKNAQN